MRNEEQTERRLDWIALVAGAAILAFSLALALAIGL